MLAVLIDDEPTVLEAFQLLLGLIGFEVIAAPSADEAVAALREGDQTPDLIVSDYRLADNKSGIEAIREVHEIVGATVPGMIITGDTSPARIKEIQESGFRLIHKPIRAKDLKAEIFDLLDKTG